MVSAMMDQFREMQLALSSTIEHYDTPEFRALDDRIASLFDAIYRHVPVSVEETRAMAGFFLDMIEKNDAGDNRHLIDRLRIIMECPAR